MLFLFKVNRKYRNDSVVSFSVLIITTCRKPSGDVPPETIRFGRNDGRTRETLVDADRIAPVHRKPFSRARYRSYSGRIRGEKFLRICRLCTSRLVDVESNRKNQYTPITIVLWRLILEIYTHTHTGGVPTGRILRYVNKRVITVPKS